MTLLALPSGERSLDIAARRMGLAYPRFFG
jgi:hypothetical protein